MRQENVGVYPANWPEIAQRTKDEAGWRCVRCGIAHGPPPNVLTVHHLDGDKSNCRWFNLVALCQRCHLIIQARVIIARPWIFNHSDWFKPYVAGYYAWRYLSLDLTRADVMARLDELLGLEARELIDSPPIEIERFATNDRHP